MTRTICTKIISAAALVVVLACLGIANAHADEYASCDKVKHGQSGQAYAWKKDC